MRQFNVRVPDDLYEQARVAAEAQGITLSDFVRDAVSRACDKSDASHDFLTVLREEMRHKNEQIDHLQQLLAMQTKTTAALNEQNQLLLEDQRHRKLPLLRRIFRWT